MEKEIKVGSVVILNSVALYTTKVHMTVVGYSHDGKCVCEWIDVSTKNVHSHDFPKEALTLIR